VTIMFRGREQAHPERGRTLLDRLFTDISDLAVIEQQPLQEGRNMSMLLAPSRELIARQAADAEAAANAEPAATSDGAAAAG
jgi:translation initiation factor IF-3